VVVRRHSSAGLVSVEQNPLPHFATPPLGKESYAAVYGSMAPPGADLSVEGEMRLEEEPMAGADAPGGAILP
jgi:hypothetical protein